MFSVRSPGIVKGVIDAKYGILSDHVVQGVPTLSFPLEWSDAPVTTKSFALVFQDFDDCEDSGVSWLHWLAADIPGYRTGLAENASRDDPVLIQGTNSWVMPLPPYGLGEEVTRFYGGPAPERTHEYELEVYALDRRLGMERGFRYNQLRRAMEGRILASAVLKGRYVMEHPDAAPVG